MLPFDDSCSAASAAAGGGFVWLASAGGAICKIDETTGAVVGLGTAAGSGAGLVIVDGSPWLTSADGGVVVLDPAAIAVAKTAAAPAPGTFKGSTYSIGRAGGDNTVVVGNAGATTGWVRYTGATIGHVALGATPTITLFAGFTADTLPGGG